MVTDRNAAVSRMNEMATTPTMRSTIRLVTRRVKSTLPAVVPVTKVVTCCLGSTSSRSRLTRAEVAPAWGRVVGMTLNTAVSPDELTAAGPTEATPEVAATLADMPDSSDWVAELDSLGSATTTASGPLTPTPKPCLIRS